MQNWISEGRYTLPIVAVYAMVVCMLTGVFKQGQWLQFAALALSAYLMIQLNNSNALIRIYSRMVSCSFLVLITMTSFLMSSVEGALVQLCMIVFYMMFFHAYQDNSASGRLFYAFVAWGTGYQAESKGKKEKERIIMIIVMKPNAPVEERDRIISRLQERGYKIDISAGNQRTILGIIGDTSVLNPHDLMVNDWIEKVMRVEEPFKRANRAFHPEDTVVDVGGVKIGGRTIQVMAGPCSVETRDQVVGIAKSVKMAGAHLLRGGAFKPRTSPYSFQGLGAPGLDLLKEAREETGLPVVTELMSTDMLDRFVEDVDMIQVGARNMQNYTLLRELGRTRKPVLLKRGLAATVQEWLMSAEYIMAEGNPNVVLCERGIRTFEDYTRNTLDLSAVLAAKKLSHLPVVVDPSHAAGLWWMVPQLAKAAVAAGADGLLIEVHNDPEKALCDGAQSLKPERFAELMGELKGIARIIGRDL